MSLDEIKDVAEREARDYRMVLTYLKKEMPEYNLLPTMSLNIGDNYVSFYVSRNNDDISLNKNTILMAKTYKELNKYTREEKLKTILNG